MPEYLADRRLVFCVAYFGYAFAYVVRNNFRLASPSIGAELGLTPVEIGTILASFTVSYGLGKVLMGVLVDRTSMKGMLACSLLVSAVICAAVPFASGAVQFIMLLGCLGLVQGAGAPASLAMIDFWYPNATRGAAVSLWNTSQNLGAAALAVFASFILERLSGDWRLIFWLPAAAALIAAALVWRFGRDRPWQCGYPTLTEMYGRAGVPSLPFGPHASYWGTLAAALVSTPALFILIGLNAVLYFVRFGLINWMGTYLTTEKGLTLVDAHRTLGIFEFAAIPAVLLFALLVWKWPARTAFVGAWSMGGLALLLACYSGASSSASISVLAALLGGLVYAPQVIVNILTLNLSPSRVVGAAIGIVGFSGYLVGEVLANLLLPHMSQATGWSSVYLLLAGTAIIAAMLYASLGRTERRAVLISE